MGTMLLIAGHSVYGFILKNFRKLLLIIVVAIVIIYMLSDIRNHNFYQETSIEEVQSYVEVFIRLDVNDDGNIVGITSEDFSSDVLTGVLEVTEGQFPAGTNSEVGEKENAKKLYSYFVGKGLEPAFACGILGHLSKECSINPTSVEAGYSGVIRRFLINNNYVPADDANESYGRVTPFFNGYINALKDSNFVKAFYTAYGTAEGGLNKATYHDQEGLKKFGWVITPGIGAFSYTGRTLVDFMDNAKKTKDKYPEVDIWTIDFQFAELLYHNKVNPSQYGNTGKSLNMIDGFKEMYSSRWLSSYYNGDIVRMGAHVGLNRIGYHAWFWTINDANITQYKKSASGGMLVNSKLNIKPHDRYQLGKKFFKMSKDEKWVVDEGYNTKIDELYAKIKDACSK